MTSTNKTIDDITRRLQGRYLTTIDDVTGIPGQAPAIVISWGDDDGRTSFDYDTFAEFHEQLENARGMAAEWADTHDIKDNTL